MHEAARGPRMQLVILSIDNKFVKKECWWRLRRDGPSTNVRQIKEQSVQSTNH